MIRGALVTVGAVVLGVSSGAGSVATVADRDRPSPSGVRVLDTSGARPVPCPAVDPGHEPFVTGGCAARVNAFSTVLNIRTVFGRMRFGDCLSEFDAVFAADGRMWLDDIKIGGTAPCNDTWPCSPPRVIAMRKSRRAQPPRDEVPPWTGSITGTNRGDFVGSFSLCIDTCVGRYRGRVPFRMVRGANGWQMRADSVGLEDSSLEVDADWDLVEPPTDLDFEAAGSAS